MGTFALELKLPVSPCVTGQIRNAGKLSDALTRRIPLCRLSGTGTGVSVRTPESAGAVEGGTSVPPAVGVKSLLSFDDDSDSALLPQ
jgi:hypothetical protein